MVAKLPKKIFARQHEITADFLMQIDKHLAELMDGKVEDMLEIRDFAGIMFIHPTHLSNTIKQTTGKAPCYFFEIRIMDLAKDMLVNTHMPVADIASKLTFDPSNFTKFFKRFADVTPKQYREQHQLAMYTQKAELTAV